MQLGLRDIPKCWLWPGTWIVAIWLLTFKLFFTVYSQPTKVFEVYPFINSKLPEDTSYRHKILHLWNIIWWVKSPTKENLIVMGSTIPLCRMNIFWFLKWKKMFLYICILFARFFLLLFSLSQNTKTSIT